MHTVFPEKKVDFITHINGGQTFDVRFYTTCLVNMFHIDICCWYDWLTIIIIILFYKYCFMKYEHFKYQCLLNKNILHFNSATIRRWLENIVHISFFFKWQSHISLNLRHVCHMVLNLTNLCLISKTANNFCILITL